VNAVEAWLRLESMLLALELARVVGVLAVAPLPWSLAPLRVRAALALMLAGVAHGVSALPAVATPTATWSVESVALAVGGELLVGAAMGFIVRLAIAAAEIAADVASPLIGLGVAQVFDPGLGGAQPLLAKLYRNFAILLALLLGVHRVLLGSLLESFRVIPAGHWVDVGLATPVIIEVSGQILATGVRLAIPVIAVLFVTQLALAFVSRAAPAMQIFSIGFAVMLAVGTAILILVLPDTAYGLLAELSRTGLRIETLLTALLRGSP
jgi:flagellar biosynthetic protein FliR